MSPEKFKAAVKLTSLSEGSLSVKAAKLVMVYDFTGKGAAAAVGVKPPAVSATKKAIIKAMALADNYSAIAK